MDEYKTHISEISKINRFWSSLYQSHQKNSLIGCVIEAGEMYEEKRADGLVKGHGYAVTKLATVMCNGKEQRLIRFLIFEYYFLKPS